MTLGADNQAPALDASPAPVNALKARLSVMYAQLQVGDTHMRSGEDLGGVQAP